MPAPLQKAIGLSIYLIRADQAQIFENEVVNPAEETVLINDPLSGDYYGGLVAAPVFAKIMANALRILSVPPDKSEG